MSYDGTETNDVLKKIRTLCDERNWTLYKLSKESGIATSSLSNMFSRNTQPSIYTIERLCEGFGISVSEFFDTPTKPHPDRYILNGDEKIVIETYRMLPDAHRELFNAYLYGLAGLPYKSKKRPDISNNPQKKSLTHQ